MSRMNPDDFALTEPAKNNLPITVAPAPLPLLVAPVPVIKMRTVPSNAEIKPTVEIAVAPVPESQAEPKKPAVKFKKKDNRAPLWHPTEEQYFTIRDLAEIGWSSAKIADALEITPQQFAGAMTRYPRVKQEYETGVQNCKSFPERRLTWQPTRNDLARVEELAAKGYKEFVIADKLGAGRTAFFNRMTDTPQLKEAYEKGESEYCAQLLDDSQKLLDNRDPDLKFVAGLLIFKLKAHCGLVDRPEKQVFVGGKIEHTHRLKAPQPVPNEHIAEYARIEMERAKKLGEEQMKGIGLTEDEVIDV
jgi:hypothetical protein